MEFSEAGRIALEVIEHESRRTPDVQLKWALMHGNPPPLKVEEHARPHANGEGVFFVTLSPGFV